MIGCEVVNTTRDQDKDRRNHSCHGSKARQYQYHVAYTSIEILWFAASLPSGKIFDYCNNYTEQECIETSDSVEFRVNSFTTKIRFLCTDGARRFQHFNLLGHAA